MKPGNDKYSMLIEHLPDAFAYHQLITDSTGNPVDYIFLAVNRAFEEMFNLPRSAVMGKKITEIFPNIKASPFDWIDAFGKVALTGENLRVEHYFKSRERWHEITAYSDTPGFFVVLFRDITEKKQMEEEVKESKEKYLLLSKNVSDVIWTADLNLKYTYVSQSVEKLYGYTSEEFLSFSIEKTLTQKSRNLALQAFHEEMAVEQLEQKDLERTRTIKSEHICKSGSTVWVEVKMSFLRDEKGYPTGILGVSRDISRRRQAEHALKKSEEKLSSILTNMSDAVWSLSWPDCKPLFYNDNAKELYGYSGGEFNLQNITEMTHPDDRYQVGEAMQKLELEGSVSREYRLLRPDGSIIWIHDKARLIMDKSNNPVRIDGIARDITGRKQIEETLMQQNNLMEGIINGVSDVLAIQNSDHTIERYNRAGYRMLIMTPDEVQHKKCYELLGRDRECDACTTTKALQTKQLERAEKYIPELGLYLDCHSNPVLDEAGNVVKMVLQLKDITERKESEKALRESEARNCAILSAIPDLIFICDRKGVLHDYHASDKSLLAVEPSQFLGKSILEVLPADIANQYLQSLEQAHKTKELQIIDYSLDVPGGSKHFEARITPMDEQKLLAVVQDITVRRHAETEIAKFKTIAEQAIHGSAIADLEGNLIYINDYFARIHGYTPGQLIGKNLLIFHNEKQQQKVKQLVESTKKEGSFAPVEVWHTHKNGTTFPMLMTGMIIQDEAGAPQYLTATAVDITAMKRVETELKQKSDELDRYFTSSLDLLCIANTKGEFIRLNPEWEKVLGYPLAELEGRSFLDFVHPEDIAATLAPISRLDAQEEVLSFENRYCCKDGSYRWIEWRAKTQGEIIYAVARDITGRKQAEQKLADHTLELEQLYHQLDTEMDKARQVHERTLPTSLPTVEGISFAAHYQPAQKMGGDLYDVIHKDNKLIFYISDVSGHSLDGAMLSVFIKEAIDSYINLKPDQISPHRILKHLSRQYNSENYDEELYFCIFMAALDLDTLELSYCGAGFQQEMLLRLGNGKTLQLATKGMFITSYMPPETLILKEETVVITPGTTIFLASDGLAEQGSQGAYYWDRLPDIFYENAHLPAHLVAQTVVEDFRQFNNGSLQGNDDITFLVLQVEK